MRQVERGRAWLWMAVKLAISGAILWQVARRVDLGALVQSLRSIALSYFAVALALLLLIALLGGLRWWIVLKAIGYTDRLRPLVGMFWIIMMFSQILPSAASDGVRIWLAARRGQPLDTAVHAVFLERVWVLLTLLLVVVATQPLVAHRVGSTDTRWIAWFFLLAGVACVVVLTIADRLTSRLAHWRPIRALAKLSRDSRRLVCSAWVAPLFLLGILTHLNFVAAATLLGLALGLPLSFADYLAFIPLVTVAMILPISISGWGIREGLLVFLLGLVGVSTQDALAFSLLLGLCGAACSLPGLVIWWLTPERHARKVAALFP